jgi:hypothetical protein
LEPSRLKKPHIDKRYQRFGRLLEQGAGRPPFSVGQQQAESDRRPEGSFDSLIGQVVSIVNTFELLRLVNNRPTKALVAAHFPMQGTNLIYKPGNGGQILLLLYGERGFICSGA